MATSNYWNLGVNFEIIKLHKKLMMVSNLPTQTFLCRLFRMNETFSLAGLKTKEFKALLGVFSGNLILLHHAHTSPRVLQEKHNKIS